MGSTSVDSSRSIIREQTYKTMSKEEIFTARSLNASVDPYNLKVREARDSEVHPNTVPIIIAFDVTGSMGNIPYNLSKKYFVKLMESFLNSGVNDAAICFCAFADHYTDEVPLQVGQFESGDIELDATLTSLYIGEHGGGGQMMESPHLIWKFAADYTVTDAWEKRGQKGYLFTISDEWVHPRLEAVKTKSIFGAKEASEESAVSLLEKVKEKWNVYHIHCSDGSYGTPISSKWQVELGENCFIKDSSEIVDVVTSTVLSSLRFNLPTKGHAAETTVTVEEAINPTTNHNFIK